MNRKYEIGEKVVLIKSKVAHLGVVIAHVDSEFLPFLHLINSKGWFYTTKGKELTSKHKLCTWEEFVENSVNSLSMDELEKLYNLPAHNHQNKRLFATLLHARVSREIPNIPDNYIVFGKVMDI